MVWILVVCINPTWAGCANSWVAEFKTSDECYEAIAKAAKGPSTTLVCYPKSKESKTK